MLMRRIEKTINKRLKLKVGGSLEKLRALESELERKHEHRVLSVQVDHHHRAPPHRHHHQHHQEQLA